MIMGFYLILIGVIALVCYVGHNHLDMQHFLTIEGVITCHIPTLFPSASEVPGTLDGSFDRLVRSILCMAR